LNPLVVPLVDPLVQVLVVQESGEESNVFCMILRKVTCLPPTCVRGRRKRRGRVAQGRGRKKSDRWSEVCRRRGPNVFHSKDSQDA
jgi:hypothetical protein